MKSIADPVGLAQKAADAYAEIYGVELVAVVLYGSAAGKNFDPKRSDINLLIVLSAMDPELIAKSAALQAEYVRKRFDRPLFMDEAYIRRSCDSYPMEFLDIKLGYRVLVGRDVFATVTLEREHLRLQVERELRGKWLHLLHEYGAVCSRERELLTLIRQSFKSFLPVFRALVHLKGKAAAGTILDLVGEIETVFALTGQPLRNIADACTIGRVPDVRKRFNAYATAIKKIIDDIDTTNTGGMA
jgi:predicted nucleotidyltransferase